MSIGRRHPLHLQQIGGSQENGTNKQRERKDHQWFKSIAHSFFRLQTLANVVQSTGVKTEHFVVGTERVAQTHLISRVHVKCELYCAMSLFKSHSTSSMFHRAMLDAQLLHLFPTPFPTPTPNPMNTPSLLYPSTSSTPAAPQRGFLSGRLVEQSPLTGSGWARVTGAQPLP